MAQVHASGSDFNIACDSRHYIPIATNNIKTNTKIIFIVTPCILETTYYTPTNVLLYCNSLKSLH